MDVFHREDLARQLAEQVLSPNAGTASSSGVFLAAPRRTGKSTFLREDLRPQLERSGALVVYADLWEDRKADPAQVIVNAVRAELMKHEGVVKRLARATGVEKIQVGGALSLSIDKVGLGKEVSLSTALAALSDETKRMIVLVIDEAQHAITSDDGAHALFALKAARDEINSSRHHGLRIVATGSNRDKLAMLRSSREQAFFGAPLVDFPLLGADYVAWFCQRTSLPGKLDPKAVFTLFRKASFKPEILGAAADRLRFDFELKPAQVASRFKAAVDEQIRASHEETLRIIHSLTPLQSAILRVMAARPGEYAPFESETFEAYRAALKSMGSGHVNVDDTTVQKALGALQERGLVWRAARGVYDLEDAALAELMEGEGMLEGLSVRTVPLRPISSRKRAK